MASLAGAEAQDWPALESSPDLDSLAEEPVPFAEAPKPSIWVRIKGGFSMPPMDNELVREWERWYSARPDYVARMIARSSHFLFHVVEEVEKRGMPMELALLPMIESAYNPVAYSRSHASGIWQFIPSTGRHFGLRQNWWYDGRRDVIAATEAALDYLEKLYGLFGDWQLALASYNCGEGAIGRAMDRNRTHGLATDYESLAVPAETRGYVPKLMAIRNIISDPGRFGLEIVDVPDKPYFDVVTLKRHIDVKLAAKLAGMPVEEFQFLNPAHKKPVIKAGEAERIVLPKDRIAAFRDNLKKYAKALVSWKLVRLRRGQTPAQLAAKHGMSLRELKHASGLRRQKRYPVGQPILVRVNGGVQDPQLPALPATPVSLPQAIRAARAKATARGRNVVHTRPSGKARLKRGAHTRTARHARKPLFKRLRTARHAAKRVVAPRKARVSATRTGPSKRSLVKRRR